MTMYEMNFSLLVEDMLKNIVLPEYRQIIVEVRAFNHVNSYYYSLLTYQQYSNLINSIYCVLGHHTVCSNVVTLKRATVVLQLLMVVSIVLERNPELEFHETVDLDQLVKEAFSDFQRDRSKLEGAEKQVNLCLDIQYCRGFFLASLICCHFL